ncbi:MAG: protein-(glutamine-N5) methyltransferase, release factor-specific [Sneathiella sp.]|uniref:peptide chain release factor N(5)-glutamine methyltransferase n=1 Tax=Sneathiella sp. TaxID=1964365 RepID=UPI000C4E6215|nr:peptide chain release factor N(5)-glutamine methyltransferase [Sneathiella sp.]MAZ02837.1 protein-(glutamine-N5) methyltransferase, release factor-specific [Sneathiella sp.]
MSVDARRAIDDAAYVLRAADVPNAKREVTLLLAHVLGEDTGFLYREPERLLTAQQKEKFDNLVERRSAREPLSHLTGHREFWSLDFLVTADVLDPRADSETLIEAALLRCKDVLQPRRILDLGTGSGCLLLSLLSELPEASGVGIDKSEAAIAIARENAHRLEMDERAEFALGNWGRERDEKFDLVISNPPYIPNGDIAGLQPEVRDYEPHLALVGGSDGLDCYREILFDIRSLLRPGGLLIFEVGVGQAPEVGRMMQSAGISRIEYHRDLASIERCVSGLLAR